MPTAKNPASPTPPARTVRRRGIALALTGAILWGGSGVAGQYILQDCTFSTEWLVGVRLILSGAMLLLIDLAFYRQDLFAVFRKRRDAVETVAFAVLGMLGVQYTYFAAIKYSNAATGTILQYLMPVVIVAWTALRTRRLPPFGELLCVALAVLGTFLLVTHGSLTQLAISPPALFWGMLSAFAAAFYTVQPKRLICKYRPTLIIGWGMLVGGLLFVPVSRPWDFTGLFSMAAALLFSYIILFGTVIAFACYLGSLQYLQPAETSILGSAEPLAAILLSVTLLHITFTPFDLLGALSILAAVILLTRK